ncbi:MAG: hypothetical protein E4H05_06635 [Acidimicrobiales bacterium]|nr:MAG: hypothetical protein E4H05_06635 [Acidimicrobiales bacterium]
MSSPTIDVAPAADATRRGAIGQLTRIEAASMARRLSLWIGIVLTVVGAVSAARGQPDWSAKFRDLVPLSIFPLTFGTYIAAVRAGNRDRSDNRPPIDEAAPLDGDDRTVARLGSLVVPVGFTVLLMVVIGVASRIEGGFRFGDGVDRTESAMHSAYDLLQAPLVIAVVGAAGIAIGRAFRWAGPSIVIGLLALFMALGPWWLWNDRYVYTTALIQVQPLEFPNQYVVHAPTVALHDLYLLGLVAVFSGLALRSRPSGRLVIGGAALAALAVVGQLAVSPF